VTETSGILAARLAGDPAIYSRHVEHKRLVEAVAEARDRAESLTRKAVEDWRGIVPLARERAWADVKVALRELDEARAALEKWKATR
jgi:hypothetical protein